MGLDDWVNLTLSVWFTCIFIVILNEWALPTLRDQQQQHEAEAA